MKSLRLRKTVLFLLFIALCTALCTGLAGFYAKEKQDKTPTVAEKSAQDSSRDSSQDGSLNEDGSQGSSQGSSQNDPQDIPKDSSQDGLQYSSQKLMQEQAQDGSRDGSQNSSQNDSQDIPKDSSQDSSQYGEEKSKNENIRAEAKAQEVKTTREEEKTAKEGEKTYQEQEETDQEEEKLPQGKDKTVQEENGDEEKITVIVNQDFTETEEAATSQSPEETAETTADSQSSEETAETKTSAGLPDYAEIHGIPVVIINTDLTVETINASKSNVAKGSLTMFGENGELIYDGELASLKGRGSSSWTHTGDQKPYNIKLGKKAELIKGAGAAKKWCLLCYDTYNSTARHRWIYQNTFLNSVIGFKLYSDIGGSYAISYLPVDLYINKDFRGTYILTEPVQLDEERINITESKYSAEGTYIVTESAVITSDGKETEIEICYSNAEPEGKSGGFILEMDSSSDVDDCFFGRQGVQGFCSRIRICRAENRF